MRIAYLGNFEPRHSTETHVAASIEALGHEVSRLQEGSIRATDLPSLVEGHDIFLHTQTYGLAVSSGTWSERAWARDWIKALGIPTVFFHLDLWWGLARQDQLLADPEPWVAYDYLFTADGGHQAEWASIGANHIWSPPGVYHAECYDGTPDPRFKADVAFVGSLRNYGHAEHAAYRRDLHRFLRRRYPGRFRVFPEGGPAIRNEDLNNLYASVKVVIGDSCLANSLTNYCSDRVPETTGRGGFLIHPYSEGTTSPSGVFPYIPTWQAGDWGTLHDLIDHFLADDEHRRVVRKQQARDTRENHTYLNRLARVLDIVSSGQEDTQQAQGGRSEQVQGATGLGNVATPG